MERKSTSTIFQKPQEESHERFTKFIVVSDIRGKNTLQIHNLNVMEKQQPRLY